MLKQFREKLESAGFRSMAARGLLACPSCGTKSGPLPDGVIQVISCPSCGVRASSAEWTVRHGKDGAAAPGPVAPPPSTRITRSGEKGEGLAWDIPASANSGGFMFFAVFWCLITAVVSVSFLAVFLTGRKTGGDMPVWILIPFFGVFWSVGLGMMYVALRTRYARHRVSVENGRVILLRELFGRTTAKSPDAAGILSVSKVIFYQKNNIPVHGVEITGAEGKLRFGSMLSDDEKDWLVDDMRRSVMNPVEPAPVAATTPRPLVRQSYFAIPVPKGRESLVPFAFVLMGMGSVFAVVASRIAGEFQTAPSSPEEPAAVRVFDLVFNLVTSGFHGIFMLVGCFMILAGVLMLVRYLRARGKETRLEATDSEISIRTYRNGRILADKTFPRSSVTDIRCSASGSSNGKPMKRIELIIGDKVERIAWWVDGDLADAFVEEARGALG